MPVINNTPTKTLSSCDAAQGALFTTTVLGCNLRIANGSPLAGITNIEYEISLGATVVETINTTATLYDWEAASLYYGETLSIKQTITSGIGTFEYTADVGIPSSLSSCVFEFSSNNGAADTFDPGVVNSASNNIYWRFPDDTVRTGATQSVLGSLAGFDGTTKEVRMHPVSFSLVSQVNISNDKVVGYVDFTKFTAATVLNANTNPNLTSFNVTNLTSLQQLYLYGCGITGAADVSDCTSLSILHIYSNTGMTNLSIPVTTWTQFWTYNTALVNITFPSGTVFNKVNLQVGDTATLTTLSFANVSGTAVVINAEDTSITSIDTTTFNFSTTPGDNCQFDVGGCTSLTTINHTGNTGNLQNYIADQIAATSLTIPFDFSVTGNVTIFIANASNLTTITYTGTGLIRTYRVYSNDLTGTHDISMFNFAANSSLWAYDNPNMTSINHGSSKTGTFSSYQVFTTGVGYYSLGGNTFTANVDCDMFSNAWTAAEINEWLVNMDNGGGGEALLPASATTGNINLAGSNAAPDGSSGGFDGTTAKANIIADGYTVSTN